MEDEKMEMEEPGWVKEVLESSSSSFSSNTHIGCVRLPSPTTPNNSPFFSVRKYYPPPPDGFISREIRPDGSNTFVSKAELKSEEICLGNIPVGDLKPGEKRVVYSGNMQMFGGAHHHQ